MMNNTKKIYLQNTPSNRSLDNLDEVLSYDNLKRNKNLLRPHSYLGISKLEENYFKFLNENLIITANATNLLHFDLVEENFQRIESDYFYSINKFFSFENTSYLIIEEAGNSDLSLEKNKLNFIDYNYGVNFPKKSIYLDIGSNLLDISISSDNTKFCMLDQNNTSTFFSIWCLDQMIILDKIQINQEPAKISFFPNDSRKIIVVGKAYFQIFLIDKNEKIFFLWNLDLPSNYTCLEWFNPNEVFVGDDCGHVILFNIKQNEIVKSYDVFLDMEYLLKNVSKLDEERDDDNDQLELSRNFFDKKNIENLNDLEKRVEHFSNMTTGYPIRQILRLNNGFICLLGKNKINIYQENSIDEFSLKHFCQIVDEYSDISTTSEHLADSSRELIIQMGINKSQTCLVCFSETNNIYKLDLTSDHIYKKHILKLNLVNSFHYTKILSIDTCYQKPLMVTYAQEGQIKIWNFIDKKIEHSKKLEENVSCVAIHPTGLYLAVSFLNKIDLYSLVVNDLKQIFSFKLNHSYFVKFSNGGSHLAACSLNTIKIYNVWTFEKSVQIKQRIGKIQHFVWLEGDQCILSCSNSGIICIWNAFTGHRLYEYIEKQVQFKHLSVSMTENNLIIFAIDKHTSLRIMSCKFNKTISSEANTTAIEDIVLEKMFDLKKLDVSCFCSFGNALFFGTHKGHILHIMHSLAEKSDWQIVNENFRQNCGLSQLVISNCMNRIFLTSAFENGLLVLCNLNDRNESFLMPSPDSLNSITNQTNQEANLKMEPQAQEFFNDILITKTDIKKIISNDLNLKQVIIEQEDDQNYQLKLKDMIHKEQTKTINYEAKLNLTCLRSLYKEIRQIDEDKFKKNYHRLDKLKFKLQKDLQFAKENAEFELNKKFVLSDQLSSQLQELNLINKDILNGINRLSESNAICTKLESSNLKNIEKIRINELHSEMKFKLEHFKKVIKHLKNENFEMETNQDDMLGKMIVFNQKDIDSLDSRIRHLKIDTCFVRKKICQIKEKFAILKERQQAHNENFLKEKKVYALKLEQVDNFKKVVDLNQNELDSKIKNRLEMTKKIDQLNKINYILKFELDQVEQNTNRLKAMSANLKTLIESYEQNLSIIIQKKIGLLKQINQASNAQVYGFSKKRFSKNNQKISKQYEFRYKNPKLLKSFFKLCKSSTRKMSMKQFPADFIS